MILVATGDSFVWGNELKDCQNCGPNGYSRKTYASLLAENNSMEYVCQAYPGFSNQAISRTTINSCENFKEQDIFVLVSWTFAQRFEFKFSSELNHHRGIWHSISSWHVHDQSLVTKGLNSKTIKEFAYNLFKNVSNEDYEVYTVLREILFTQYYLKSKNIPYLFTCSNNIFFQHDCIIRAMHDESIKNLWQQIDWNNWYWFPTGINFNETQSPRGFYQWATENKYTKGPNDHPLEDAHYDAAILIMEKFNELVKKHHKQD